MHIFYKFEGMQYFWSKVSGWLDQGGRLPNGLAEADFLFGIAADYNPSCVINSNVLIGSLYVYKKKIIEHKLPELLDFLLELWRKQLSRQFVTSRMSMSINLNAGRNYIMYYHIMLHVILCLICKGRKE